MRERNVKMLKMGFTCASVVCILILLLSCFSETFQELKGFYLFFSLWFVAWEVLTFTVLVRHHVYAKLFYGVLSGTSLTITAIAGSYFSPDMIAVTYLVFLIFIPGLYINRPTCCITTTILSGTIFCFMVVYFKSDPTVVYIDIVNTIFCMVVGIVFNLYSINVQLENIESSVILKEQSTIDELTGLPNRRCFNRSIEDYFESCGCLSIVMMDIDFFKRYNDTYGHLMGDDCLAQVGACLRRTAQEHDVFIARYGGEEFIAIDYKNGPDTAKIIADAFVHNIAALQLANEKSDFRYVTLSAGYATYPESGAQNYMQLINFADAALYQAKSLGRNRSCKHTAPHTTQA